MLTAILASISCIILVSILFIALCTETDMPKHQEGKKVKDSSSEGIVQSKIGTAEDISDHVDFYIIPNSNKTMTNNPVEQQTNQNSQINQLVQNSNAQKNEQTQQNEYTHSHYKQDNKIKTHQHIEKEYSSSDYDYSYSKPRKPSHRFKRVDYSSDDSQPHKTIRKSFHKEISSSNNHLPRKNITKRNRRYSYSEYSSPKEKNTKNTQLNSDYSYYSYYSDYSDYQAQGKGKHRNDSYYYSED